MSNDTTDPQPEALEALEDQVEKLEAENEELRAENREARELYAEALAGASPFDAETLTEKFTLDELRDRADDTDDVDVTSEVTPRTSAGDSGGQTGEEALSQADAEQVEALERRRELFKNRNMPGYVDQLDDQIADLRGDN